METNSVPGDLSDEIKRVIEQEANAGTGDLSTETGYESIGLESMLFSEAVNKVIQATGLPGDDVTVVGFVNTVNTYESRFGINVTRVYESTQDELATGQILDFKKDSLYRVGLTKAYDLVAKKKSAELKHVDLKQLALTNGYSVESMSRRFGTSDPEVIRRDMDATNDAAERLKQETAERRANCIKKAMPCIGGAMGGLAIMESASKEKIPAFEYMKKHPLITVAYIGGGFLLGTGVGLAAMEMAKPVHNGVKFITGINRFGSK